ncbi:hypothetical protein LUZ60_007435 [Juncus effusus]|nr:hypothetical protein LUZ60_007435 [Juncus effusus]
MAPLNKILAFAILSSIFALSCAHNKQPVAPEPSSASGSFEGLVKFGYSGSLGPEKWASLSPEFAVCGNGKQQSPINIVKNETVHNEKLGHLDRAYMAANGTLVNNGFNIGLKFDGNVGTMLVEGKNYSLKHLHWHSPSEHTIDGERFPMELHLVHQSNDGNVSVMSILYQYGKADSFLFQIMDKLVALQRKVCGCDEDKEAHISLGLVRTRQLKRHTRKYYRYVGSLTTPPCTENVVWNILGKVRTMTKEQADALRAPLVADFQKNCRPTQALNGRTVQMYDEVKIFKKNHQKSD